MRPACVVRLLVVLGALTAAVFAAEGGFIATLSTADQQAAGLTRLSAEQQLALNTQIAREVSLARQGGVSGFAGTFSSRRPPAERAASGLDQLAPEELAVLDRAVASALAAAPVPITSVRRMREAEFERQKRYETHGEVSFVYGFGSDDRRLIGGSVYTEVHDRQTGVTLGVGVSRYDSKGFGWGYDDPFCDYGPGLPLAPLGRGAFHRIGR
jgi:hypothetical protein